MSEIFKKNVYLLVCKNIGIDFFVTFSEMQLTFNTHRVDSKNHIHQKEKANKRDKHWGGIHNADI